MSLPANELRCQGARGSFGAAVARGSMPADCCQCLRRTAIEPGQGYTYLKPVPTWTFFQSCPKRVAPAEDAC